MNETPSAEKDAGLTGMHPCVGCGVELDADDLHARCDECEVAHA